MRPLSLLLILSASCAGDPEPAPPAAPCASEPLLTWDNWAEGFFRTWCTACHASTVTGADRNGAPEGLDYDEWEGVVAQADRIRTSTLGDAPSMPPLSGTPDAERDLLDSYLKCGLATPPTPTTGACVDPVLASGDIAIATQADADALCAEAQGIAGNLTITGGTIVLDCLCAVGGDLDIRDATASVSLAALGSVGGDLRMDAVPALASFTAPELDTVGGALAVTGTGLDVLHLGDLDSIGGGLSVTGNPGLVTADFAHLKTLGGDLVFESNPALLELEALAALEAVPGDLRLVDLAALVDLNGFDRLAEVGGSLTVTAAPVLVRATGFRLLTAIGGSLALDDLPRLALIEGFSALSTVAADFRLVDLPAIDGVPRFDTVTQIGGELEVTRTATRNLVGFGGLTELGALRVSDNPALTTITGFEVLTELGGALVVGENPGLDRLDAFGALTVINGDLSVSDSAQDLTLTGLRPLTTIGGALVFRDNVATTAFPAPWALETVGSDLIITGNLALPNDTCLALAAELAVGGVVTISGNGP